MASATPTLLLLLLLLLSLWRTAVAQLYSTGCPAGASSLAGAACSPCAAASYCPAGSAPIASAEPEAPPLQQSLLRSLGVLRLGGGAVPLHLTRAAEAASGSSSSSGASSAGSASALFFLATLSPSTGGASGGGGGAATRWVYKVVALEACAEGGVSGGAWEGEQ
jgi:uncharacterized membrane protein YgcG